MKNETGFEVSLNVDFNQAVELVTAELKNSGFGVLTEIDVQKTLKKKLDVGFHNYVILGACNPPLAYRALSCDPAVGLMLPCNVTVESKIDKQSIVRIINPEIMLQTGDMDRNAELTSVATKARKLLEGVAERLASTN